jgi:hypothetical protein
MDADPDDLGQLDEVLLLTGAGLVGRALVVGPIQAAEPHALLLPVLVTNLFEPVPLELPETVAGWLATSGPNPRRMTTLETRLLTLR